MELFLNSCQQTENNITILLDSLLESNSVEDQLIENLLQMNERIKNINNDYEVIRIEFGLHEVAKINEEEYSARQLASQLSVLQLCDILDQFDISYNKNAEKTELEEILTENGMSMHF